MLKYSTVVIGGGAASICEAISKGRRGEIGIIYRLLSGGR